MLGRGELPEPQGIKIVVGPIASGAPVLQDPQIFDRLSNESGMRKVIGLEMEVSSILTLAYLKRLDYAVAMKGVMDHADSFKSDNMKNFAARASAECLIEFLRAELPVRHVGFAEPRQPREERLPSKSVAILDRRLATELVAILAQQRISGAFMTSAQLIVTALALFDSLLVEDRYGSALLSLVNSGSEELRRGFTPISPDEVLRTEQAEEALMEWKDDPQLEILASAYGYRKGTSLASVATVLKQMTETLTLARRYDACVIAHPSRWSLYAHIFQNCTNVSGGARVAIEVAADVVALAPPGRANLLRALCAKHGIPAGRMHLRRFGPQSMPRYRNADTAPYTHDDGTTSFEFLVAGPVS